MKLPGEPGYHSLIKELQKYPRLGIAFSGGVDSTFLLAAAQDALGSQVMAFTIRTAYMPNREMEESLSLAKKLGVSHKIISVEIPASIQSNPLDRCYLCKKELFGSILKEAAVAGIEVIADGSNLDDDSAHRPGRRALAELNIKSPLRDAGLGKEEIRRLSALLGLSTAQKPAYACLLTRLPYNHEVTSEELNRIEKAEDYLHSLGYSGVRVRAHDQLARIEVNPVQLQELTESTVAGDIIGYFKKIGFTFVTLDLEGYRSGGMDPVNENK